MVAKHVNGNGGTWHMPLKCWLEGLGLLALCEYQQLQQWRANGVLMASSMGKGGRYTHVRAHTHACARAHAHKTVDLLSWP